MIKEAQRDGYLVVVTPTATLPGRCVKCNAECPTSRLWRRISTLSAWYPLFSSAGWNTHCPDDLPIFIPYNLCVRHRLERFARAAIIGFFGAVNLACLAMFRVDPGLNPAIDLLAVLLPLPLLATILTVQPALRPRRVHHGLAWLSGAGPEFLNSLEQIENSPSPGAIARIG